MILIFGPQGSGKGEQTARLMKKYGWRTLSTGDLLRASHDPDIQQCLNAGELVNDELMARMLDEALLAVHSGEQVTLDGYPRTVKQAARLTDMLGKHNMHLDIIIKLDVPLDELMRRFRVRQRHDDTPAAIQRRLEIYNSQIGPILEYYQQSEVPICEVDGLGKPEVVEDRIAEALGLCVPR